MDLMRDLLEEIHESYSLPGGGGLATAPPPGDVDLLEGLLGPAERGQVSPGRDNYAWYWAVAHATRPERVLELGAGRGWAATALLQGAAAARRAVTYRGYDDESATPGCVAATAAALAARHPGCDVRVDKLDIAACAALPDGAADLVHVDLGGGADVTRAGLKLARAACRPGGLLLVNRAHDAAVREAVADARFRHVGVLGTPRGLCLLVV